MASDVSVVEATMDEHPFLHVHFGDRKELLAWFERAAAEAGEDPEDHVITLIEIYRDHVEAS